uniref:Uncharacterized protein n=1 Tax=Tetranychus urticae TaxID=32264 RepID=T1KQY4_TETUR
MVMMMKTLVRNDYPKRLSFLPLIH